MSHVQLKGVIKDIPYGTNILIIGEPGTGQNQLAINFLSEGLEHGVSGLYFGFSWNSDVLNRNVDQKFKKAITEGKIRILTEDQKPFTNLNEISVSLFNTKDEVHELRAIIDSLGIVALKFGVDNVLPWILNVRHRMANKKIIILRILETGMHPKGFENSMMALSDTVFETKTIEEQSKIRNVYRIRNSNVMKFDTEWKNIKETLTNVTK